MRRLGYFIGSTAYNDLADYLLGLPNASGEYDGAPEQWQLAETALQKAIDRLQIRASVVRDEAAFYGPKIDVKLVDATAAPGSFLPSSSTSRCRASSISNTLPKTARSTSR